MVKALGTISYDAGAKEYSFYLLHTVDLSNSLKLRSITSCNILPSSMYRVYIFVISIEFVVFPNVLRSTEVARTFDTLEAWLPVHITMRHKHAALTKHRLTLLAREQLLFGVRALVDSHVVQLVKHLAAGAAPMLLLPIVGIVLDGQMAVEIADSEETAATLIAVVVLLAGMTLQMDPETPGPLEGGPALGTAVPWLLCCQLHRRTLFSFSVI